ncbi:hypothetical protein ATER59S_04421 [Aquamicrobium terrae]
MAGGEWTWRSRLLLFIVIFGGASIYGWFDAKTSMRSLAQEIIDDNIAGNALSVDFITIPVTMALPFSDYLISNGILFSEVSGYFTVKRKDNGKLADGCEFITPDYTVLISTRN